jgi:hypothetical protein
MVGWYHFCLMRPRLCGGRRSIPPYHLDAEIRELLNALRWARIVREHAARLWGETKRQSDLEFLEGAHLSVEPIYRLRTQAISPAQPRTQVLNAQTVQPEDRVVEPVILEVKPLANAEVRRILREGLQGEFGRAILAQQPHVKVPVIGRPFRLAMSGRGRPGTGEVIQTVPVNPLRTPAQELSHPPQAELLNLLGAKGGGAYFGDPHGEIGHVLNFFEFVRPFIDIPMIPV